ncbi:sensor histidine kinase [Alteribacillus sp. HJP-4]|uniref:cache domain-containing sensor histidine kinase n=1 Tax=Alteribacillus sp. HJP-4 TaxID=2775394 RepID=UPI0035CCDB5C
MSIKDKTATSRQFVMRFLKTLHPTSIFNQFTKIRNKIFSLTFLLLFAFGVLGLLIFHFLSIIYEDKIFEESADSLHLASTVLDRELEKMEELSFQIVTDPSIQSIMADLREENISYDAYRTRTELTDRLTLFLNQESYISSVQVIDVRGDIIRAGFSPEDMQYRKIINRVDEVGGRNIWQGAENGKSLLAAREIKQEAGFSLENLGYLMIMLNLEDLIDDTLNFSSNKNFVITHRDEIIYSDEFTDAEVNSFLDIQSSEDYQIRDVDGSRYFITPQPSRFFNMTYYNILSFENVASQKQLITRVMIIYIILVTFITVFISRQSAKAISRPIEALTLKMKKVQQGNFDQVEYDQEHYLKDEIGDLQQNFHIMLDKINELIKENYTKQLVIKETEYKALQSQINPHFLYNTLDSIHWMAKMNQQLKISAMAEALGNMMRNIISKKDPLIKIKEELEIVENYITIQKYRYSDRLNFHLERDPELDVSSIPKLTIQPIVENAIQHGLEEMIDTCTITVNIVSKGDFLDIIVKDNGPGMPEETIEQIYEGKVKPKGSGIGLYNINERIHLMFGNDYGVNIASEIEQGTTVTITLPYIKG